MANPVSAAEQLSPRSRGNRGVGLVLAVLALAVLTYVLFRPALSGEFLAFDDDHNIALNEHLGLLDGATVHWAVTDFSHARRYMPLGWLTFSALLTVRGFDAGLFHTVSLLLHVLNGLLLLRLLAMLVRKPSGSGTTEALAGPGLLIVAAWWLWHPLRVEAVAWSSGLLYVAATTWMLLAAVLFLASWERRRGAVVFLVGAHIAYACSLFTYGIWLGAPVALAAAAVFRLRQSGVTGGTAWRRILATLWPALVLSAVVLALNLAARSSATAEWGTMVGGGPGRVGEAGLRALATLGWFLLKIIWPVRLTPADDMWAGGDLTALPLALGLGTLTLAGFGALRLGRRLGAGPGLALLAFLAVELPVAGFTEQNYPLADRYTYSGQVIVAVVLVLALARCRGRVRVFALTALLGLTAVGAVRAWRQIPVWRNSDALFAQLVDGAQHEEIRQFFRDRWRSVQVSAGRVDAVEQDLRRGVLPAPSERLVKLLTEARQVQADAISWGAENTIEANAQHQFARAAWDRGEQRLALMQMARAVELAPHNWPAWADYAAALWTAGDRDAARRALGMIPDTGPASACREHALQVVELPGAGS